MPAVSVRERLVLTFPPMPSAPTAEVPTSVALAPPALVARCHRTVNPVAASSAPVFEMVEEKVRATPAVAVTGVTDPAVRFGYVGAVMVVLHVAVALPPALEVTVTVPFFWPVVPYVLFTD